MRTLLFVAALLVPASAGAVTVRDIIELTRAGLPDDVLVAVIDADRTIFTLDKDQILELKKAGVSKQVLIKMLRTRREFETVAAPEDATPAATESRIPQPEVVVIGAQPAPPPVTVVVPQYFYVPYAIWGTPVPPHGAPRGPRTPPAPFLDPAYRGFGRFINDGWVGRP
jgi:hypothetical protein